MHFDNLRRTDLIDIYSCQVYCLLYVLICWTFRNSTFYSRAAFIYLFIYLFIAVLSTSVTTSLHNIN